MRAHRVSAVIAGVTAIALGGLLVASPAAAAPATLPAGQKITVIEQDFVAVGPPANTYFDVSPADASSTQVGTAGARIVTSIDVNDDGVGYGTGTVPPGENQVGSIPTLYPVNAATGVTGPGVTIDPVDPNVFITACPGIDLQPDGTIVLACYNDPDNLEDSYLGVVTPGGAFTVYLDTQESEDVALVFSALAFDAVTGVLWVFADDEGSAYWPVDRTNPTDWSLGNIAFLDVDVFGADFDSAGQLFATIYQSEAVQALATIDLATGLANTVNGFNAGGSSLDDVRAITVWGKKALPATGPAEILPIGLGTALLLLAGAAFVATSRIQRRTA